MASESQGELTAGAEGGFSAEPLEQARVAAGSNTLSELSGPGIDNNSPNRWKRRVTLAAILAVLLAAALVLPPLINISRYQRQITALMTRSMGRPVRMSGVELRLLPSPGFVLHDLAVSEDPAFGAEPILSARTVVASVRLFSLWRGRLEISEVSVDEASLNLVRSPQGRWNLESLLMGAQPVLGGNSPGNSVNGATSPRSSAHFPYLQATDSWVHFKSGVEKSPFALASTDLSLWQDDPGQWRVRLRGQPVRTDMPMSLADTGEVRMEASLKSAAQLHEMPIKLQMEWREAQLGQLSRLLLGRDAGWRGDLTADIEVQGTPEAAVTKARLRATGVRRQEFVPETSLDFDANCSFRYQHSQFAFHDVGCDTAIGDGRLHLKAEVPGLAGADGSTSPEAMLEVQQVPLQAALDLLRTVRSGFAPAISAKGTVNGSLRYKEVQAVLPEASAKLRARKTAVDLRTARATSPSSSLQGSVTITEAELSGGKLQAALKLPEITLIPAEVRQVAGAGIQSRAKLVGLFSVPMTEPAQTGNAASEGAANQSPANAQSAIAQLANVQLFLDDRGYQAQITGSASIRKLRELAYGFGWQASPVADGFHGGTADFTLAGQGAWVADASGNDSLPADSVLPAAATELTLHHTEWQADYLAHSVNLAQATVHWVGSQLQFSGDFTYGGARDSAKAPGKDSGKEATEISGKDALRGNVAVKVTTDCAAAEAAVSQGDQASDAAPVDAGSACLPNVQLHFEALDAALVEAALEAVPTEKSVFSPLTDRMRSSSPSAQPRLPEAVVSLQADSLVLGPVTLQKPAMHLRAEATELKITDWEAEILGGTAKGTGSIAWSGVKPEYSLAGSFTHLSGAALASLLDGRWAGGTIDGGGKVSLSGLVPKDLAGSASGDLHFDWQHGTIVPIASTGGAPSGDIRFDRWSGDAAIEPGKIAPGKNVLEIGRRTYSAEGAILFGGPAKLTLNARPASAEGVASGNGASGKAQN